MAIGALDLLPLPPQVAQDGGADLLGLQSHPMAARQTVSVKTVAGSGGFAQKAIARSEEASLEVVGEGVRACLGVALAVSLLIPSQFGRAPSLPQRSYIVGLQGRPIALAVFNGLQQGVPLPLGGRRQRLSLQPLQLGWKPTLLWTHWPARH